VNWSSFDGCYITTTETMLVYQKPTTQSLDEHKHYALYI